MFFTNDRTQIVHSINTYDIYFYTVVLNAFYTIFICVFDLIIFDSRVYTSDIQGVKYDCGESVITRDNMVVILSIWTHVLNVSM